MNDNDIRAWEVMMTDGGSFTKALAACMLAADGENLRKIKATWPELLETYRQAAKLRNKPLGEGDKDALRLL